MSSNPDDVSWLISSFVDQTPASVEMIGLAAKHGIGEADLGKLSVEEIVA